jgi:hypothetical protein
VAYGKYFSRIDMLSASYAQTKPSFPIEGLSSMTSQNNPSTPLAETGFACLLDISNPSSPIIKGFQELVSLTTDIRSLGDRTPSGTELISFTGRRTWTEWAMSALDSNFNDENMETMAVINCCRLSAQIYANIVLRKMELGYAVLPHLANNLNNTLCQTDLNSMWEDRAELLTWCLFQGGAVAMESGIRKWYVSHLVPCSKLLGLQAWNDVLALLEKFLWVSPELERHCKPLWYEIAIGLSDFETIE